MIPSDPVSKTCRQTSTFLFGSLTSESFLLISKTLNKLGKFSILNIPCSKSKVEQSNFLFTKSSNRFGSEI